MDKICYKFSFYSVKGYSKEDVIQYGILHTLVINYNLFFLDMFYLHDEYCLCAEGRHVYTSQVLLCGCLKML